jgi:hypothetical protein
MRNIFRDLNDLPDKPRLGVNLIIVGLAIGAIRLVWPFVAPSSFQSIGMAFFHWESHLPYPHYPQSPADFGIYVVSIGLICFVSGSFIFFRRGFWWVAEHRDEKNITRLDLK